MSEHARIAALVDFWFGPPGRTGREGPRAAWFKKDPSFDTEIARRFAAEVEASARGELDHWTATPAGGLALLLLLDQFPRNLYRGQARAFASDPRARQVSAGLVERGDDRDLMAIERVFVYLPFEHGEALVDQERSVALFAALPEAPWRAGYLDYAERHREVIRRFGRFPHRNQVLGRASTPEETEYLAQPGSGF